MPGERCIELRSFKYYLFSYRNRGIFYEDVVNRILDDVVAVIDPQTCVVTGDFNARGGISARVTASYPAA
jgi:7-cyano-7-deazaguanine reductase